MGSSDHRGRLGGRTSLVGRTDGRTDAQPACGSVGSGPTAGFSVDDEYDDYYEAVARELYEQGEAGIEVHGKELAGRRVPQLRAALTVLAMHQSADPEFVDKVESLTGNSEPVIAGDAIRLLGSLGITDLGERIRGMGEHPSPFVRASVLD